MGLNNVAMIMAPNLFFLRTNDRANVDEIRKAAATTDIMRMLLKYQIILWTVSKVTCFVSGRAFGAPCFVQWNTAITSMIKETQRDLHRSTKSARLSESNKQTSGLR